MMNKKQTNKKKAKPIYPIILQGERVPAIYKTGLPIESQNNPLTEALPRPLEDDFAKISQAVSNSIEFDPSIRQMSASIRLNQLEFLNTLVFPNNRHIKLYQEIDRMLRLGYYARNPYQNGRLVMHSPFNNSINENVDEMGNQVRFTEQNAPLTEADQLALLQSRKTQSHNLSLVQGTALIGPSGIGKTTLIDSILYTYPQVIYHHEYRGQPFNFQQLVWLKLECPFDGSHKQLILNLIASIDNALGTNFMTTHAKNGSLAVDSLIPKLQEINYTLRIGAIVIDEIQRLSKISEKSVYSMLEFLVQFSNTVKVPLVLVGTNMAMDILTTAMQQIRRVSTQGDIEWRLPKADDYNWNEFLKFLFSYQYVRDPVPMDDAIAKVMFEKTQGITDLAVKLFKFAQRELILKQELSSEPIPERITPELLGRIADEDMRLLQPAVKALASGTETALKEYEDLYFLYKEKEYQAPSSGSGSGATPSSQKNGDTTPSSGTSLPIQAPSSGSGTEAAPSNPRNGGTMPLSGTSLPVKAPTSDKSKQIAAKRSKKTNPKK